MAIILILLTSVGVVLGFLNMKCLGSSFVCVSMGLSVPCLFLSYVLCLVFMVMSLLTSQVC